jgi:uncharacterized protein involved in exopolysaccharide biosynthesis
MTVAQPYVPVSRRPLDLEDYINVARRHSGWIAGPTFAGLVLSIVVAFCLPNVYEAKAVMQITPSQISDQLVQSTLTQQLNERISQMESNITSRQSLATLINDPKLNLYKDLKAKEPMEDIEDEMRRAIKINVRPDMGYSRKGASVFEIGFSYSTRKGAVDTVNALITRFIAESTNTLRDQQNTVQEFFGDEYAQAKANLDKQNELLTLFRKEHEGRLPEQQPANIAALNSVENQINGINQNLIALQNQQRTIEGNVSILDNQMKLRISMDEETQEMAPPVVNSPAARQNDDLLALNRKIDQAEIGLQTLRLQYSDSYVDVRNMQAYIKSLKKQRDDLQAKQAQDQARQQAEDAAKRAATPNAPAKKTTNFRAAQTQIAYQSEIDRDRIQLKNLEADRDAMIKHRDELTKEGESYRAKLQETSALLAQYQDLMRDNDAAVKKYETALQKKELTAQSQELISRKATEYLDTLDAPTTPQKPSSPKRPLIVAGGLVVSLMLGISLAGVQEARDTSLKNLKDVRAYTNLPVLCSIPLLENTLLVKRKRRIMYLAWSAAVILGILAVCGSLFYYSSVIAIT